MILLTGGSGFIGSNLLSELNKAGINDAIIVDNINSIEKSANLNGLNYSFNINKYSSLPYFYYLFQYL